MVVNTAFYENFFFIISFFVPLNSPPHLASHTSHPVINAPHLANNAPHTATTLLTPHIRNIRWRSAYIIIYAIFAPPLQVIQDCSVEASNHHLCLTRDLAVSVVSPEFCPCLKHCSYQAIPKESPNTIPTNAYVRCWKQ